MFSDARSLWSTATTAFATINENISTALEKIDAEIDAQERKNSTTDDTEQLRTDLDAYKTMLDEAQMQHFELSKQSRILMAEKEAEIQSLKAQLGPNSSSSNGTTSEGSSLKLEKLMAEKRVLEGSLEEAQAQMKQSLRERNEYLVMKKTFDDLQSRFQSVKSDLSSLKAESDVKEKQKSETIENLVGEYSKLAAEAELAQQQADLRVAEVLKENEILVTKMHALEHSITELADRTVSPAPPAPSSSTASMAGISTPCSSRHSSRADLAGTPTSSTAEAELKEAKSKIVNLQFDIKEKETEIARLKVEAVALVAAHVAVDTSAVHAAHSNAPESAESAAKLREEVARCEELSRKLSKLQQDFDNQSRDVSRLNVEKKEADEAGRKYLEQSKRVQAQYDALVKQQRQQQEESAAAADQSAAAAVSAAVVSQLQSEVESLRQTLADSRTEHAAALASKEQDAGKALDAAKAEHAAQVAALREEHERAHSGAAGASDTALATLRSEVAALNAQISSDTAAHAQTLESTKAGLDAQMLALESEKQSLAAQVVQKTEEIAALKASHEAQLQATMSGGDADRQKLVAGYVQQNDALTAEVQRLQGELTATNAAVETHKSQLASAKQDYEFQLTAAAASHQASLQAAMSGSDADRQSLVDGYVQQIEALKGDRQRAQGEHVKASEEAQRLLAEATAERDQLAQQVSSLQQDLSAALAEKEAGGAQLAQKVEEIAAVRAEYEAKLQAALSGGDSERQALVNEYQQQIAGLKEEITAAEELIEERDNQITALQGQLTTAAAEAAALSETITQRDAELRAAEQTQMDLKAAHVTELESQRAAAQSELESQRAALTQQLRDCEESIGVLRDSHREELLAELDSQQKQLNFEHVTALEQALATAAQAAAAAQQAALDEQSRAAQEAFEAQAAAAKQAAEEEKTSALQENTAALQAEKEAALVAQATANAESLAAALAALSAEKDALRAAEVDQLRQEKKQELEAAVAACRETAAAQLQAAQADFEQRAAALDAQIEALKADLAGVDAKHKQLTEQALAALGARKDQECVQALAALRQELRGEIEAAYKERDEHLENYSKERKLRKKIHNRLLEIQGNIRVLCRVRPILEVERRSGEDVDVTEVPNDEELYVQRDQQCRTRYEYDRVFPQNSTQEEVFEAVQPLCVSVLDGYNVCIFAYGQTGSGKTFTMEGSAGNKGVSPRAIEELLGQIEQAKDSCTYSVTLSMLEIYNETILDLLPLNPNPKEKEKLEIRQTGDGNQVVGLTETSITSMAQVEELMRQGQKNRAVGSHDMNEHSSRSHSIITIVCRGKNLIDGTTTYGKLHLIDLAGSERVGKTDATGDRLKEAQNINKSLSALGEVINALGNKKATHVPYRNSKLTFLLQDSLGGNSKVLTFVNISPAVYNLGETVCSLNFATRCRSTELGQAKKQSGPAGEESATKPTMRRATSSSTSLNSSGILATPAAKK